jgi:hypothetical protein
MQALTRIMLVAHNWKSATRQQLGARRSLARFRDLASGDTILRGSDRRSELHCGLRGFTRSAGKMIDCVAAQFRAGRSIIGFGRGGYFAVEIFLALTESYADFMVAI